MTVVTFCLTCFRHSLSFLHTSLKNFFGRDKKDAIAGLSPVHHTQLLHQEVGASVHVLPTDLTEQPHHVVRTSQEINLLKEIQMF